MFNCKRPTLLPLASALVVSCLSTSWSASAAAASTPFKGVALPVPGYFEAEDFDNGGQGVAYHDVNRGNLGGHYRNTDVDIVPTIDPKGGNYDINWFATGEWLNYTVDVQKAGRYDIMLRVVSALDNSAFSIRINGKDVSGRVKVPNSGDWSAFGWITVPAVALQAGKQVLTIVSEQQWFGLNSVRTVAVPTAEPYRGTPMPIPGYFEAEDFDNGGQGLAYHDDDAGNQGGAYRNEDVDIVPTRDAKGGGHDINWFDRGEWLGYTVDVAETGNYNIELRVVSGMNDSAFHIEIDGEDVTGPVSVPNAGNWTSFSWVGKQNVPLTAGRHQFKIVSDSPYFGLNSVRVEKAVSTPPPSTSTPYYGTRFNVPGYFEAEDFDRGGQGLAYGDNDAGNRGSAYRTTEDVDIVATRDAAGGGYDINWFENGEWLTYSINVTESGDYNIELRVASALDNTGYRVEIDGKDVTGLVTIPNSGSWNAFRWVKTSKVPLSAGHHTLKVVAERQYFGLNSIRIEPTASAPDDTANLLFASGFEGNVSILPPADCWGTGCWQDMTGLDSITNFNWPSTLWGGDSKFLILSDPVWTSSQSISDYMFNRIEQTTGPRGNSTNALFQQITKNVNGTEPMGTSAAQNELQFLPKGDTGDLYISYWVKLQPDLVEKMNNLPAGPGINNGGTWRAFFSFKTGGQTAWGGPANDGDYRVETYIMTYGGGQPYWVVLGDNNAGGGAPLVNNWSVENRNVPVPVGRWFKFEIFWHRSNGNDGRVWAAVDGQTIADHRGPNMGAWNMPINRIMAPLLYSGSRMPIYQWIDDIEMRSDFPSPTGNNPPYAPH